MVDLTLHILNTPASHELSGIKKASRYLKGDVIDVYPANRHATWDGTEWRMDNPFSDKWIYVHIINPPMTLKPLKGRLLAPLLDQPANEGEERVIRRREFVFRKQEIAPPLRNKINQQGECSANWPAIRAAIKKKIIAQELDATLDNMDTSITDGEI